MTNTPEDTKRAKAVLLPSCLSVSNGVYFSIFLPPVMLMPRCILPTRWPAKL